MKLKSKHYEKLLSFYSDEGAERGGFLTSEEVIECKNSSEDDTFYIPEYETLERMSEDDVIATFHTHPNKTANLSKEDFSSFQNWGHLYHFIIGNNGIMCYKVNNRGNVVIEEIDVY